MNSDLLWILNSPSLMRTPEDVNSWGWLSAEADNLNLLEVDDFDKKIRYQLGIHYENLVNKILSYQTHLSDIKRNIQVISHKTTLGEFDFVGRSARGDFHLECAIKFYLRVGKGDRLHHYIGPGKRDRLDIKWERLLSHQIPLSDSDAGKALLDSIGLSPNNKVLLLQGYLFHPFGEGVPETLAPEINPNHLSGWWIKSGSIELLSNEFQYIQMHKPHWMNVHDDIRMSLDQLKTEMALRKGPALISRGMFTEGLWCEKDRGFIVPENWIGETGLNE